MTSLSPAAQIALKACIATRGINKGGLLATAPSPFKHPTAYAAWQAAQMVCNPFKVSICGLILLRGEDREVYDEVLAFFEAHPGLRRMDRDRRVLEALGAW